MPTHDVLRELSRAKAAVDTVTLGREEGLVLGELIARNQLMLITEQSADTARLDPEARQGRTTP